MKKILFLGLIAALGLGVTFYGCTKKKVATPQEAIQTAQTMQKVDQKINYLIFQAKAFYNSKEYKQAIETAQYVLAKFDFNSKQAQEIIIKAREQLKAKVDTAATEAKKKLDAMGK